MKRTVSVSCPLDCFDLCRFKVDVEDNTILKIIGDPDHPVTQGLICKKGKGLKERFEHPDRILYPLVRKRLIGETGEGFQRASYDTVTDLIASRLRTIRDSDGPAAVMDYIGSGYGGLKGRIQTIFFNHFGGATRPKGSLCWGAGIAAQKYDFGTHLGHSPDDVLNAKMILVWGRNPKVTNLHLYTRLKKAEKNGARIIVLDPNQSVTSQSFKEYIRVQPSTDGALALAMAKVIIDQELQDKDFVNNHVLGFNRFKASLKSFSLEKAQKITGIPAQVIEELSVDYAKSPTACIYLGLGMQRYENGGNSVRAINSLASICGKIGKKGCGVNYAAKGINQYISGIEKESVKHIKENRYFSIGQFAQFLNSNNNPPVKAIFVAGTNPLNQGPDLSEAVKSFSKIPFKVVFDHFLTDTAKHADIVLPPASVFEQEDIFATSMFSPVLNYSEKAIEPPETVLPEFDFYLNLSKKLDMDLGFENSEEYLMKSAAPVLEKLKLSLTDLKTGYPVIDSSGIAWEDKQFQTPSGKIEIYSENAKKDGLPPLPEYIPETAPTLEFPLRLLTCHTDKSMHSQAFAFAKEIPEVFIHPETMSNIAMKDMEIVWVETRVGKIKCQLKIDPAINKGTAFMYQGFWHESGSVNMLTEDRVSDMGLQAAYYDTFCRIVNS